MKTGEIDRDLFQAVIEKRAQSWSQMGKKKKTPFAKEKKKKTMFKRNLAAKEAVQSAKHNLSKLS